MKDESQKNFYWETCCLAKIFPSDGGIPFDVEVFIFCSVVKLERRRRERKDGRADRAKVKQRCQAAGLAPWCRAISEGESARLVYSPAAFNP